MKVFVRHCCILFTTVFGCCFSDKAAAQRQHTVRLKVLNAIDSLPIPSLPISVYSLSGTRYQQHLTDHNGNIQFLIDDSLCNKAYIKVSSDRFEQYAPDTISCEEPLNGMQVFLHPVAHILQEVRAVQRQVTKSGEKLIYQVKHDRFSVSVAGSDVLRKLPGVTFVSGSVKLNGREGVLILIDGKGEQANQQEQLVLLAALNLSDIVRIEIISSPSARYDAHITSIINVITRKSRSMSTLKAGVSSLFYPEKKIPGTSYVSASGSSNFNFKISDIRTSLLLGLNNGRSIENSLSDVTINDQLKYKWQNESVSSVMSIQSNLGLDYDIDSNSSIGINFMMNLRPSLLLTTSEAYTFYNYNTSLADSSKEFDRRYHDNRRNTRITAQYRQRIDKKKNSLLYVNLIHASTPFDFVNEYQQTGQSGSNPGENGRAVFNSRSRITNASVILTDPVKQRFLSTETGLKLNHLGSTSSQLLEGSNYRFNYTENLYSLFFSTRWKMKQVLLIAEMRAELLRSQSDSYDAASNKQLIRSNYFKLYPNLLLQWNAGPEWTFSLGYNKRIRRPFISDLNPAVRFNGVLQRVAGSPEFQPTYFDKIEMQVQYKGLVITPSMEWVSNRRIFIPENDPFELVARNYGKQQAWTIVTAYDFTAGNKISANLSAIYRYTLNRRAAGMLFRTWNHLFVTASAEYTPTKNTRVQLDLYFQPPMRLEYSIFKPYFSSTVSIRQLLVKDRLSLNFSITDAPGLEKNQYNTYYPGQSGKYRLRNNNRSISLQVVYNFPFGQKFKRQTYKNKDDGEIRTE